MNWFLYYFDKWTSWLDFSWLVTIPKKEKQKKMAYVEPLLEADSYHK
jgi:hypothetical protein